MDDLWTHLSDNGLHTNVVNIPNSCLCMLCNSIMRHPVSTKCGCVFCEHCIRDYLLDDRKPCPGCLKENDIAQIEYTNDITECKTSSREILRLVTVCPLDGCEESFELRALLEHLISCSMMKNGCMFKSIGCSTGNMNSTQLEVHLSEESIEHYKLIVEALCELKNGYEAMQVERESVNAVRNEMSQMKEDFAVLRAEMMTAIGIMAGDLNATKAENVELRGSVEQSQNLMETMRKDINEIKMESDLKEREFKNLRTELDSLKEQNIELNQVLLNHESVLENVKEEKENSSERTNVLETKLHEVVLISEAMKCELEILRKEMVDLKTSLTKCEVKAVADEAFPEWNQRMEKQLQQGGDQANDKTIQIRRRAESMFVQGGATSLHRAPATADRYIWTATRVRGSSNGQYSDAFLLRGYHMLLKVLPGIASCIETRLYLVGSSEDAALRWPMKLTLRLRVMDPDSGVEIWSETFRSDRKKPKNTNDKAIIQANSRVSLSGHRGAINKDTVVIHVEVM